MEQPTSHALTHRKSSREVPERRHKVTCVACFFWVPCRSWHPYRNEAASPLLTRDSNCFPASILGSPYRTLTKCPSQRLLLALRRKIRGDNRSVIIERQKNALHSHFSHPARADAMLWVVQPPPFGRPPPSLPISPSALSVPTTYSACSTFRCRSIARLIAHPIANPCASL
jgi:hypothetical protein